MLTTIRVAAVAGLVSIGVIACAKSADVTEREDSLSLCRDNQDNDDDGLIDCAEGDCANFAHCQVDTFSEDSSSASDSTTETSSDVDSDSDGDSDSDSDTGTTDTETDTVILSTLWSTIPAGAFWMGSPDGNCPPDYPGGANCELEYNTNETLHYVSLTRSLEIMRLEVTQGLYNALMGWNPSYYGPNGEGQSCGVNCPIEYISWFDAIAFANQYSQFFANPACYGIWNVICQDETDVGSNYMECMNPYQKGIKSATVTLDMLPSPYHCKGYRLPTESEWEYAARAESLTAIYPSDGNDGTVTEWYLQLDTNLDQVAWYSRNAEIMPHPVGLKDPNAWGLYDMLGNAAEWTWDWLSIDSPYYPDGDTVSPVVDPHGPDSGTFRAHRGGSFINVGNDCRSANHAGDEPGLQVAGFRLVRTISK